MAGRTTLGISQWFFHGGICKMDVFNEIADNALTNSITTNTDKDKD